MPAPSTFQSDLKLLTKLLNLSPAKMQSLIQFGSAARPCTPAEFVTGLLAEYRATAKRFNITLQQAVSTHVVGRVPPRCGCT